jgi:hypothetical protein
MQTSDNTHLVVAAEIAERLEEMEEAKSLSGLAFITALSKLGAASPVAYKLTIQHMHGCCDRYMSYQDLATKRGVSKQAMQQEFRRHLAKIRAVFPAAADEIEAMRARMHAGFGNKNQTTQL